MSYLARKITRAKWERKDDLAQDEIPADVTADLRTDGNILSVWRFEESPEQGIAKVVLAIATAAERIDRMDLSWFDESSIRKHDLSAEPTDGRTPVLSLRKQHMDITKLDLNRLSIIATFLVDALANEQYRRFTRKEVATIIVSAVQDGLVTVDDLSERVREEIRLKL